MEADLKIPTLSIFLLIFMEYACFPISSEIVLPFAGGAAARNGTPFIMILALSVLAGILGTCLIYGIGYFGGAPLLARLTKRFPKTARPVDASHRFFEQHGALAVCVGRVIPICRTYISFIAGSALTPFSRFFFYTLAGITVWNSILLALGYYFYQYKDVFFTLYHQYKFGIVIAVLLAAIIFLIRRRIRGKAE